MTRRPVQNLGLSVARSVSFFKGEKIDNEEIVAKLKLPVFIKPVESGSSVGVSKVNNIEGFDAAVEIAFKESDRIIIEEYIKGRELGCGVLQKGNEIIVFPLTEIVSKKEFFDYEAKYDSTLADEITPAEVSADVEMDVKTLSAGMRATVLPLASVITFSPRFCLNGLESSTFPSASKR